MKLLEVVPLSIYHKGTYFSITCRVLRSSVGRISGESEGVFKVIAEFSDSTEMEAGSRSGFYRAPL